MPVLFNNPLLRIFFFGNCFYGLCAVALSIEALLQQKFPAGLFNYFAILFCLTIVYYTVAYINDGSGYPSNERNAWYARNKRSVKWSQNILFVTALVFILFFARSNWPHILNASFTEIFLFILFPLVAILYYGINAKFNLRKFGWLKPFVIGFTWAGVVTVYPILFYGIETGSAYHFTTIGSLLFLKNLMFISVLCIMFDIKDYAADSEQKLNTFIVRNGLRNTIFFILLPLCLIGLGTFVFYGITRHFHPVKIILNVLPFALLILVTYSLHKRRSLLYYLVVVDGLMLAKAVCGSMAMIFF